MEVKETIEKAALSCGVKGKMDIADHVKGFGVSYRRLTNLMDGKGKVVDLTAVLNSFNHELKAVLK